MNKGKPDENIQINSNKKKPPKRKITSVLTKTSGAQHNKVLCLDVNLIQKIKSEITTKKNLKIIKEEMEIIFQNEYSKQKRKTDIIEQQKVIQDKIELTKKLNGQERRKLITMNKEVNVLNKEKVLVNSVNDGRRRQIIIDDLL